MIYIPYIVYRVLSFCHMHLLQKPSFEVAGNSQVPGEMLIVYMQQRRLSRCDPIEPPSPGFHLSFSCKIRSRRAHYDHGGANWKRPQPSTWCPPVCPSLAACIRRLVIEMEQTMKVRTQRPVVGMRPRGCMFSNRVARPSFLYLDHGLRSMLS